MGFKVDYDLTSVPVSCIDNIVTCYMGNSKVTFPIQGAQGLVFEKQCNHFKLPGVRAYLKNKDYSLVLRDDSGTVFTNDGQFMRNTFMYALPKFDFEVTSYDGGSMYAEQYMHGEVCITDLVRLGTDDYLISSNLPVTVLLSREDNLDYFGDVIKSYSLPVMRLWDKELYAVDRDRKRLYDIRGEIFCSDGFTMLGGVTVHGN